MLNNNLDFRNMLIERRTRIEELYKNKNGILFEVDPSYPFDNEPVHLIYINGSQLDHYNPNGSSKYSFIGGNGKFGHYNDWYNQGVKPYIFKYIVNKDEDYSRQFALSLIELIKKLNSDKVIIVGKSYGGVIGIQASFHDLVKKVYAVNPSFHGSPLSYLEWVKKYKNLSLRNLFVYYQCRLVLEPGRGFTEENTNGIRLEHSLPLDKLLVFGGSINHLKPRNLNELFMKMGAQTIFELSGELSDGMAVWDQGDYDNKEISYELIKRPHHVYAEKSRYMKPIYELIKKENL